MGKTKVPAMGHCSQLEKQIVSISPETGTHTSAEVAEDGC